MGGSKADMEGHLAVLHGQGALAVAGFVGVEHAAVGVKLGGIHASGKAAVSAAEEATEEAASELAALEAAEDAVEEAPQPPADSVPEKQRQHRKKRVS